VPGGPLPLLSHSGVLAALLEELGGRKALTPTVGELLILDPVLALHALESYSQANTGVSLLAYRHADLLRGLDVSALKSMVTTAATEHLTHSGSSEYMLNWRQAVRCAMLSRLLAEKLNYPSPDEAWLAGLLIWLPQFATDIELSAAQPTVQKRLDRLPLRTFLPDALRYLDVPMLRLQDAAPLVQMVVAAHRLVRASAANTAGKAEKALPDAVFLGPVIDQTALRDLLNTANTAVDNLCEQQGLDQANPKSIGELALELIRYNQLELAASVMQETNETAIQTLVNLLASHEGLADPTYLKLNRRTSYLEAQPIGDIAPTPLSIRVEGSRAAAVRALFTRTAVIVLESDGDEAAVLDLQLIRQADADGLVAIPVGEGDSQGVLLVCGSASALATVAAMPKHYARMGELAVRTPQSVVVETVESADDAADALPARVRRAAHEINNPLGIIKNYLAILKVKLGDDAPISDELRIIYEELDRIVRIVRGLTQAEADVAGIPDEADLNALIQDLVKVTQPTWLGKGIQVFTQLAPAIPRLSGDRDKLKQIVLNLMLNAIEATPSGGVVRLETAALSNHRHEHFIEIIVADSGSGIAPEVAEKIFDPLDTAKGDGHAGLGLSIVKSLTESMQGSIIFKTGATGTTFQILLPTT
jgi:signal transduction histidine kinase